MRREVAAASLAWADLAEWAEAMHPVKIVVEVSWDNTKTSCIFGATYGLDPLRPMGTLYYVCPARGWAWPAVGTPIEKWQHAAGRMVRALLEDWADTIAGQLEANGQPEQVAQWKQGVRRWLVQKGLVSEIQ